MKNLWIVLILIGGLLFAGCSKTSEETKEESIKQYTADKVVTHLVYIKDQRTGIVYAYYHEGGNGGGPAITVVPEDKVPSNLITIGKIEK
jgi:hypothetical protein